MNRPKQHHYVPQFYLEGFFVSPKFTVFDRKKNEYRVQTAKNTTVEKDFYSIETGGAEPDMELETALSTIEGNARPVIMRLVSGGVLAEEERCHMAAFLGFMATRHPAFREDSEAMADSFSKWTAKKVVHSEEVAADLIKEFRDESWEKQIDPKTLLRFFQEEKYNVKLSKNYQLQSLVRLAVPIAAILTEAGWSVLTAPSGKRFVTTDNPLVTLPPVGYDPNSPWGVGFATPGSMTVFPLTEAQCLVMEPMKENSPDRVCGPEEVQRINYHLVGNARRFALAGDEDCLRDLVRRTKIDQEPRKSGFVVVNPPPTSSQPSGDGTL